MYTTTEKAHAKINLYLDIESKRDDGYHNIVSIMHSISLNDDIKISPICGNEISVSCNVEGIPCDRRNLVYRAAEAFMEVFGKGFGVKIELEKRIPVAAGLGGGSSDAAAVLRGLNRICGNKFSLNELLKIGAMVGADVPFCIIGGCAEVRGIGELLFEKPKMPDCYIVLSCAGEGISTPTAYKKLDEKHNDFMNPLLNSDHESMNSALMNNDIYGVCDSMFNVFEGVILPDHFEASHIKSEMLNAGALASMMSGSGPSVFGVFDDKEKALFVLNRLKNIGYQAYMCRPQ